MKKIPTIFLRDPNNRSLVTSEINEVCRWVFLGQGVATRKYDGTCCLVRDGILFKRREIKKGKKFPKDLLITGYDEVTDKTVGWVPVTESPEDRWHREAFSGESFPDGTYELCGPKVQGNPEGFGKHVLIAHSLATQYPGVIRTFDMLREFFTEHNIEGIVFHSPDGRMAKIKRRDYGLPRYGS